MTPVAHRDEFSGFGPGKYLPADHWQEENRIRLETRPAHSPLRLRAVPGASDSAGVTTVLISVS